MLLLIGHFFPVPGLGLAAAGVNLFFVLSGLLMGRLLFVQEVPFAQFYRRRISRIFPAMFAYLFIMTACYAVFGQAISWQELLAAALFVNNYFPGEPGAAVMPFGHIWSLSVEEHSYVLLSLLAMAVRAGRIGVRTGMGLGAVACISVGLYYNHSYTGSHLEFDRWIRTEVAAYGIVVSALLLLQLRQTRRFAVPLIVVPLLGALALLTHWWSVPVAVRTFIGVGALALAVNLLDRSPALLQRLLSFAPLRQLGLWSFSLYLWQQPFYLLVHRNGLSPWLGVGLSVLAGIASYYLVEQPARGYLNRVWGASRRATTGPTGPVAAIVD